MTYTFKQMARDSKAALASRTQRKNEATHHAYEAMRRCKPQQLIQILAVVGLATTLVAHSAFA